MVFRIGLSAHYLMSILLFSLVCKEAVATSDFRVYAPPYWKKTDIGEDGAIYFNTKSSNQQIVVLRTLYVNLNTTSFKKLLGEHRQSLSNARERALKTFGIGQYNILDVQAYAPKGSSSSGFRSVYNIQSMFFGLSGEEVQMYERQYLTGDRLFQVSYFEVSSAINNPQRVNSILDNFKPIYRSGRMPAGEEVASSFSMSPIPRCDSACLAQGLKPKPFFRYPPGHPNCSSVHNKANLRKADEQLDLATVGKAGAKCLQNTVTGIASTIGLLAKAGDANGSFRRLGRGEQLFMTTDGTYYKFDRKALARANSELKTFDKLIESGEGKKLTSDELKAELDSGLSAAIAELKKIASKPVNEIALQVFGGLFNGIADSFNEIRCVNNETLLAIGCEILATTVPPGAVLAKLGTGIKLAKAESESLASVAKKMLEENPSAKTTPKSIASAIDEAKAGLHSRPVDSAVKADPDQGTRPKEVSPKSKGLPDYLVKGDGDTANIEKLGESLRERNINPKATHIPEFAEQAPNHLRFAREAIESQKTDLGRLEILKKFEAEAAERVKANTVTYEWWHDFNYRLSILTTPTAKRTAVAGGYDVPFVKDLLANDSWLTNEGFRATAARQPKDRFFSSIEQHDVAAGFPDRVVIPLIDGDVGIAALNRMYGSNVNIIGMSSNRLRVDGREMYPDHFFRHDHVHVGNEGFVSSRYDLSKTDLQTLQKNYLQYRDTVPNDRRAAFEFGYFIATHELPMTDDIIRAGGTQLAQRKDIVDNIIDPDWYAGSVPEWAKRSRAEAEKFARMADEEMKKFSAQHYPRR